ncbi:MAG: preprotein translocase subunit SecG [Verrucomicrobiia bacterium]
MSYLAGVLTFLLVINCLLLILLILMQLPKKDAGAGMAFGGAAADALFGAGSGNFLTQATRYATIVLFVLALVLGYVEDRLYNRNSGSEFEKAVQQKQSQTPIGVPPPVSPANSPAAMPTNNLLLPPVTPPSSTPVAPPVSTPATSSNAPAAPTKSK